MLIVFAAGALAIYVWAAAIRARQMAAAKTHVPVILPKKPDIPAEVPAAPSTDAIEAALAKVSAAKGVLALAVADALMERDALLKHGVDLQAEVAAAEARLAAMGVDIVAPPAQAGAQEKSDHMEAALK